MVHSQLLYTLTQYLNFFTSIFLFATSWLLTDHREETLTTAGNSLDWWQWWQSTFVERQCLFNVIVFKTFNSCSVKVFTLTSFVAMLQTSSPKACNSFVKYSIEHVASFVLKNGRTSRTIQTCSHNNRRSWLFWLFFGVSLWAFFIDEVDFFANFAGFWHGGVSWSCGESRKRNSRIRFYEQEINLGKKSKREEVKCLIDWD